MIKKCLSIFALICVIMLVSTSVGFAGAQPKKPVITDKNDNRAISKYNSEVDTYNDKVDTYNLQLDNEYLKDILNYSNRLDEVKEHNRLEKIKKENIEKFNKEEKERVEKINKERELKEEERVAQAKAHNEEERAKVEEVERHNAEEKQKVDANQEELNKCQRILDRIELDKSKGLSNQTAIGSSVPHLASAGRTQSPKTISIDKGEETNKYNVINLHLYVDEDSSPDFDPISINSTTGAFNIKDSVLNHLVLAEWESVEANYTDIITAQPEAELMGYNGVMFRRYMDGYTNGAWIPTQMYTGTAKYTDNVWEKGGFVFSYKDGTTDRQPVPDTIILHVYNFYRYGAEPTPIDKYEPNYKNYDPDYWDEEYNVDYEKPNYKTYVDDTWELPIYPTRPSHLEKLKYLPYVPETTRITSRIVTGRTFYNNYYYRTTNSTVEENNSTSQINNEKEPVEETISENNAPLANSEGYWALINLITTIIGLIIIFLLFTELLYHKMKEKDEEEKYKYKPIKKIITTILGIGALIIFMLTEDITLPMKLVDNYTLLMIVILLIETIIGIFAITKNKDEEKDEEKEEEK